MNKIVKRILIGIGAFIFLVILAVVALFIVIDPNDYRDEISQMAYKATGLKIDLKGDISLKLFPSLGFSIKNVSVAQTGGSAQAGTDVPLAQVDELNLRMALFPLLKKQAQVDAVILDGLTLNLAKDAKGRYNWESAQAAGTADSSATPESTQAGGTADAPASSVETQAAGDAEAAEKNVRALLQSSISEVSITNCVLNYNDIPAKESMSLRLNRLALSNVGLNRDIACALDMAAELGEGLKAALNMDGQVRYELAEKTVKLDVKSFTLSGEAPDYLSGSQEIKGNLNALLNTGSGRLDLKAMLESVFLNGSADVALNGGEGNGSVVFKSKPVALLKALSAPMQQSLALPPALLADNGPLRSLDAEFGFSRSGNAINVSTAEARLGGSEMILAAPALKAVLSDQGGIAGAEGSVTIKGALAAYLPLAGISPQGGAFSKLDSGLTFKLSGDNLTLTGLKLAVDDTLVALSSKKMDIRLAPSGPLLPVHSASGDISLAARPRALMNGLNFKLETADAKVLESFQSSFRVSVDNASLKIADLKGRLDETEIGALLELLLPGAAGIPRGATSYAKASVQLGALNLDRYLPPDSGDAKEQSEPAATGAPGVSSGGPLRGTALEKARAEFNAGIKSLTAMKVPMQDINLNCVLADGVLTVSRAGLKTFDGQLNLSARADLVNANGAGALKTSLAGLNIGSALGTVLGEKRLTGQTSANLDFTFKGLDSASILKTLNGKGDILLKNGALYGIQLIPPDAPALLLGHRLDNYNFTDLGGTFTVVDGKLSNNDLSYKDRNLSLAGKGSVALYDHQVDYSGIIKTKETGEIPLRIQGPLSSLHITLDQEALAKMALEKGKEALTRDLQKKGVLPQGASPEEIQQEAQKKINEKVGQELQRGLGRLFNK